MSVVRSHNYFVYILTNFTKSVLYIGVTNDLRTRIHQHKSNVQQNNSQKFTGRYNCIYLVYWERFQYVNDAIGREKEIKGWTRAKKNALVETTNPGWKFLNDILED